MPTSAVCFLAILFIFKKDIIELIQSCYKYLFLKRRTEKATDDFMYIIKLIISTIPVGITGILFLTVQVLPLTEECEVGGTTNPYGTTKLMIEGILRDLYKSDNTWSIAILRYFNPIGAHESGIIGEDPNGIPNNLMPYITQVAIGKLPYLNVFGDDYNTHDGTGVRDYIHVVDLALGHVKAVEKILKDEPKVNVYNLGTGNGYSVLDIVKAFEQASGQKIEYKIAPRRPGDLDVCYSDASKALNELGWKAERGLLEMCEDSWRWQSNNPNGFDD